MKYSKKDQDQAWEYLQQFRNKPVAASVKSVSRSGMNRRIEFYADGYNRIGWAIATCLGDSHNDKGISVGGCGMDMVFSVLSNFNYFAAQKDTGKTIQEMLKTGECGTHIYDKYFFDADRYSTI